MRIRRADSREQRTRRTARSVLVEWEDKPGAEVVGLPDVVDDNEVADYLEKQNRGRRVKGWRSCPSKKRRGFSALPVY